MIVKLFGLLDFLSGMIIFFSFMLPRELLVYVGMYLVFKGIIFGFSGNFISFLDLLCGVYALVLSFDVYFMILNIGITIYLLQKGFFSLM